MVVSQSQAHTARHLTPGSTLGKYSLIRQIAIGGMAELYLARTTGLEGFEKLVVVKRILPQFAETPGFVQMFLDEARLAATLHHPNIAQVYDIGMEDGSYFFTMEYVHGEDLRRMIAAAADQGVPVSLDAALTLVVGVAAGLHYAHQKAAPDGAPLGIVHRDVSPSNVLVSYEGGVKVVDFGIARATSRQSSTLSGGIKGKIAYMSPEQCKGGAPLDRRSDIFSIGTLLYELTTGRLPFEQETEYAVLHQIVNEDAEPPTRRIPAYPKQLEAIVLRAMARDPAKRYPTALELQRDLEDFAHENRLRISPLTLGGLMERLFPAALAEWEKARSQGAYFVEEHVVKTLVGKTTEYDGILPIHNEPEDDATIKGGIPTSGVPTDDENTDVIGLRGTVKIPTPAPGAMRAPMPGVPVVPAVPTPAPGAVPVIAVRTPLPGVPAVRARGKHPDDSESGEPTTEVDRPLLAVSPAAAAIAAAMSAEQARTEPMSQRPGLPLKPAAPSGPIAVPAELATAPAPTPSPASLLAASAVVVPVNPTVEMTAKVSVAQVQAATARALGASGTAEVTAMGAGRYDAPARSKRPYLIAFILLLAAGAVAAVTVVVQERASTDAPAVTTDPAAAQPAPDPAATTEPAATAGSAAAVTGAPPTDTPPTTDPPTTDTGKAAAAAVETDEPDATTVVPPTPAKAAINAPVADKRTGGKAAIKKPTIRGKATGKRGKKPEIKKPEGKKPEKPEPTKEKPWTDDSPFMPVRPDK